MSNQIKLRSRWYSQKFVEENSKTELGAARMSRQKWYTLSHCKMTSLLKNDEPKCGLCAYYSRKCRRKGTLMCDSCVLRKNSHRQGNCYWSCGLYQRANSRLRDVQNYRHESDFIEFQILAQEMFELLDKCVKILENKNDKSNK